MKKMIFILLLVMAGFAAQAQQRLAPGGMTYILMSKPNNIVYHDTLYQGYRQYLALFYRTRSNDLIGLVEKHHNNVVAGAVFTVIGALATGFGVGTLTSDNRSKGLGWGLIGGGLASTIVGGALTLKGQRQLATAVALFNQRNHTALGIGAGEKTVGLVYNF